MPHRVRCFKTGKVAFPTRLDCDLDRARIEMNAKGHRKMAFRETPSRSYQCEHCGLWHMTSQTKNESRLG